MGAEVVTRKLYRHPRTHRLISQDAARTYYRRTGKRIRPEHWLFVIRKYTERQLKEQPSLRKRQGQIEQSVRLTKREAILKLTDFTDRHVRRTLADHRTYARLWKNWGGEIRITVNGHAEGRRIREVIHLGWHRGHWRAAHAGEKHAQESFKDWLVGAVLSNLRRRGLRLSNPLESQRRIVDLGRNREGMLQMLEMEPDPAKRGGWLERIKWATSAIRQQKRSKQLIGATLKIEKLA